MLKTNHLLIYSFYQMNTYFFVAPLCVYLILFSFLTDFKFVFIGSKEEEK